MNQRALVIGGGGASGNAWLIGIVAGLFDAGVDVTGADLTVGTSAGSTAAAQITSLERPTQLLAAILAEAPRIDPSGPDRRTVPSRPASGHMERTGAILDAAKDASDMRRKMGAELLARGEAGRQWRSTVAARLPGRDWPAQAVVITAVDAESGQPAVFDRESGVELVDAVAASTAGGFAYAIGDKRYIDGGYRADVNADLAAGHARVLVIAPLGAKTRKRLEWGLHLEAQVEELRDGGSRVETIFPDDRSRDAIGIGMALMDVSRRGPAARAGFDQGQALAGRLSEFWR